MKNIKFLSSELKTLEWDILNLDYLIWVSNGHTFDFLLNPFFLGYSREKWKTVFIKIRESLPFLYINLKLRANLKIYRLRIRDSDWMDFIHFSGYKYKIRLVSISIKREDQTLISISTILKFSAQILFQYLFFLNGTLILPKTDRCLTRRPLHRPPDCNRRRSRFYRCNKQFYVRCEPNI